MEKQLKKKNEELTEAQKTYKEQTENQSKTFADQLKVRNEEFEKLQASSAQELEALQKNFQEQQKQRFAELEDYKKEIAVMHERNIQSAVNEKTASLLSNLEAVQQKNVRLIEKAMKGKSNRTVILIPIIIALLIGFILAKIL